MAKYTNKSKLLGKIGTENYRVSNCPVHLPKENVKFFMAMQNAGNKDPFSSDTWGNQITPGWKKSIYESIMNNVSKELRKTLNESETFDFNSNNALNEGSWGYEPNEGDSGLDCIGETNDSICELIYDKCKRILNGRGDKSQKAWDAIAVIEHFFDKIPDLNTIGRDRNPYYKYYSWWQLKQDKGKDIVDLYRQCIEICENDQWYNEWDSPEKMEESLQKRHENLNRYLRLRKRAINEGECGGECGGVGGSYNTPMNTIGVGNVVPAQGAAMTGAQ